MLAAVIVKPAAEPEKPPSTEDKTAHYTRKPSDLPIYAPLHSLNKSLPAQHPPNESKTRQTIEGGIRAVRLEVTAGYKAIVEQKKNVENFISTGIAHSQSTIDYLNQPDNTLPRVGAIAIGGVSGLILAIRGGLFKKIIYTGVGAGGIASLCYPKEAEKFTQQGLHEAKKGVSIAYNFIKGVKPGDGPVVEPLSNFPTNLSELKEVITDLASSAKDAVFTSKK